jgi:hypothetical protein
MLVHLDHLAGVPHRQGQSSRVILGQLSFHGLLSPDQNDLQAQIAGSLDRTIYYHSRSVVASHRIDYDLH